MSSVSAPLVLDLVRRHGHEAGAFQILEAGYEWFLWGNLGCVGYVDTGRAWVAAGAPLATTEDRLAVALAFRAEAARRGRRVCFFGVEEPSAFDEPPAFDEPLAAAQPFWSRLRLGHQPEWDPTVYARGRPRRSLREQHRRARAKGVTVREVRAGDLAPGRRMRHQFDQLLASWLGSRRMHPLDFVVAVRPFSWNRALGPLTGSLRFFVAERDDQLCAIAILLPARGGTGWFCKHLLRHPRSPNGTSELLVHETLRALGNEGVRYATLGLAPLSGEVPSALRWAGRALRPAFDFDGLGRFKAKLEPTRWTAIELLAPRGASLSLALLDSLRAFAPCGRLRFAFETARRRITAPPPLVPHIAG